jgi:curved DNA-binding protein CbpA
MEEAAQDFYQILGVDYGSTLEQIEDTYHGLARKLHPDVTGGDPELTARYMTINEAYQILSKTESREKYDKALGIDKIIEGQVKPAPRKAAVADNPAADMKRLDAKLRHTIRDAENLCKKSSFWEATRMLERFLKTHPENAQLRKALASAALGRKRYHEAVNHMKIVCKVEYHNPENFVMLGEIYVQAGQLALAEKALHEAFGWNSAHEGALNLKKRIDDLRDAGKPPVQRMLRKVSKAFKRKE